MAHIEVRGWRLEGVGYLPLKVIIAGGGTGGHIYPGIAIAKQIKQNIKDADILFVGTQRGLEKDIVPRAGFALRFINVTGFKRKISFDTVKSISALTKGMLQARKIIKQFKPDIVIGTGGYVCGPVVLCAALYKIPTLIHEQNALPGITNKLLSRFADVTAVSFEDSKKYFCKAKKIVVTGNPLRSEIIQANRQKSRSDKGIKESNRLVLIAGGSGGAQKLNDAVVDMLTESYNSKDFQVIFATGHTRYDTVIRDIKDKNPEILEHSNISILPYIYDMETVMSAADLMITRAGAITISELTALGVPSIIIPSPNVTENHQEYNARALETKGAAIVILEKDLNGKALHDSIMGLLFDNGRLNKMRDSAKAMGMTDSTQRIFKEAEALIKKVW